MATLVSHVSSLEGLVLYFNVWSSFFLSGIVAFRQHLQNLARTKGILELNKVQLLYEQLGPEADQDLAPAAPQLQDLAGACPQVGAPGPSHGGSMRMRQECVLKGVSFHLEDRFQSRSKQVVLENSQPRTFPCCCHLPLTG